jgi:two-component system LytT family response regulator
MPDRAPLRVLVADDERPARQRLEDLLTDEADVELVAACASGREAVDAIRTHDLDLALLDIQMPGLSGLDVVQEVGPHQMPVVIFVTAYDQHALEAFDVSALDYLLKPFDDERFREALDRARHQIRLESVDRLRGKLLDLLEASPAHDVPSDASAPPSGDTTDYIQRIPVQTNREVRIVPVEEVAYFQSDGPYIEIHTVDDSTHLIRERMKTLDARLDPKQFCRIHRSTIVNLGEVESVQPNYHDRYVVRLSTAERLDVSRRRRDAFEDRFGLSF